MPNKFYNIIKKKFGFYILSCTWGILMTILGFLVAIPFLLYNYYIKEIMIKRGHCLYFRIGRGWGGFSLGPYCFVCKDASTSTMAHEHGHSLQNCLYGPFTLIFSICSMIRYHYRNFKEANGNPCKTKYDDFWFEGQATNWGNELFNNALKTK